jgi:hypothetical protein
MRFHRVRWRVLPRFGSGIGILFILVQGTAGLPGASSRFARQVTCSGSPGPSWSQFGCWSPSENWGPTGQPFHAIHMHVLPNGKVLSWNLTPWDQGEDSIGTKAYVWDPADEVNGGFTLRKDPWTILICSGHAMLSDGRLYVASGGYQPSANDNQTSFFDYRTNVRTTDGVVHLGWGLWKQGPAMTNGRWYPSLTALPNGDMLIQAGEYFQGDNLVNQTPDVWSSAAPTTLRRLEGSKRLWDRWYPLQFVAPNGSVFDAGAYTTQSGYLDTSSTGTWTQIATRSVSRTYASGVMYADGKVLTMGGGTVTDSCGTGDATITPEAHIIDLTSPSPAWSATSSPMTYPRTFHNSTLLPSGAVLVTGGLSQSGYERHAELWDPATGQWSVVAEMPSDRAYHSVAVLLPDARVLTAGGNVCNNPPTAEFYSPPYLFDVNGNLATRPVISAAPANVSYGQSFFVKTSDSISHVRWIRLSSVTHGFNQNQRIATLDFALTNGGLNVTAPSNPNLVPPGHYMMFLLNASGVPSIAKIVQIMPNLVVNGDFSSNMTGWSLWGDSLVADTNGGSLNFYRSASGSGQAAVLQPTSVVVGANEGLRATFQLANTDTIRKRLTVILHDNDFSDQHYCSFWLSASAPMRTYTMRTHTTRAWSNATISFYPSTNGSGGYYQVDNVAFTQAAEPIDRTECVDPTAPAPPGGSPGPEMLVNGDFGSGLSPWGEFGWIQWQIVGGVLEFKRSPGAPPGTPAGVMLQATGQGVSSNQILTATFQLGNSTDTRKRVTVLIHDNDFSDQAGCTFWLAPSGSSLATFSLRTFSTESWSNATLSVYPSTVSDDQWVRLDNVSLKATPGAAALGTECFYPPFVLPEASSPPGGGPHRPQMHLHHAHDAGPPSRSNPIRRK